MSKTINYELAKKLYDAEVIIPSKKFKKKKWSIRWTDIYWNEIKFPTPNTEEVIEFLKKDISIWYSEIFSQYVLSHTLLDRDIFRDTLLEALEATLKYLLDNGYIWNQN